jgi:hypothetical protein
MDYVQHIVNHTNFTIGVRTAPARMSLSSRRDGVILKTAPMQIYWLGEMPEVTQIAGRHVLLRRGL